MLHLQRRMRQSRRHHFTLYLPHQPFGARSINLQTHMRIDQHLLQAWQGGGKGWCAQKLCRPQSLQVCRTVHPICTRHIDDVGRRQNRRVQRQIKDRARAIAISQHQMRRARPHHQHPVPGAAEDGFFKHSLAHRRDASGGDI